MRKEITTELLNEIDQLIRNARGNEAKEKLLKLHESGIPCEKALEFASLATRAELPELSVQALHPIVRPSNRIVFPVTDAHCEEYALALLRLGACSEARNLLNPLTKKGSPQALFYRSLVHLKEWDYAGAIPLLKRYILSSNLSAYQVLLGKLNLANAYIFEEYFLEAKRLLAEVLEETARLKYDLLHANALRFLANLEIHRKNWDSALMHFETSKAVLDKFEGLDRFLVTKWVAIINFARDKNSKTSRRELMNIRQEAVNRMHWESVRDIDLHISTLDQNYDLMLYLYFGTPFPRFKERIDKEFNAIKIPETFDLKFNGGSYPPINISLKPGKSMHRLYLALITDFYRPSSIASLFEQLNPGEYYSPRISAGRVYLAVRKLRSWFKKHQIPLEISNQNGDYRLVAIAPCTLRIQRSLLAHSRGQGKEDIRLAVIREHLGEEFSLKEAAKALNLARRSMSHVLLNAVKEGILTKTGKSVHTKYRFVMPVSTKKAA